MGQKIQMVNSVFRPMKMNIKKFLADVRFWECTSGDSRKQHDTKDGCHAVVVVKFLGTIG